MTSILIHCPHCDGGLQVQVSPAHGAHDAGCPDECATCGEALNPNEILSSALHAANERDWALEAKDRAARLERLLARR